MDFGTHNYVGTAKCGCRVAVVADMPGFEKDTGRAVAEMIRDGYVVTRETHEEYRQNPLRRCKHKVDAREGKGKEYGFTGKT